MFYFSLQSPYEKDHSFFCSNHNLSVQVVNPLIPLIGYLIEVTYDSSDEVLGTFQE